MSRPRHPVRLAGTRAGTLTGLAKRTADTAPPERIALYFPACEHSSGACVYCTDLSRLFLRASTAPVDETNERAAILGAVCGPQSRSRRRRTSPPRTPTPRSPGFQPRPGPQDVEAGLERRPHARMGTAARARIGVLRGDAGGCRAVPDGLPQRTGPGLSPGTGLLVPGGGEGGGLGGAGCRAGRKQLRHRGLRDARRLQRDQLRRGFRVPEAGVLLVRAFVARVQRLPVPSPRGHVLLLDGLRRRQPAAERDQHPGLPRYDGAGELSVLPSRGR